MAMPRRARPATRRKSGGNFLLGVFVGLILGLGVALAVAFYINNTPVPFASKKKPAAEASTEPEKLPPIAGMPQGGAGAQKTPDKPKFDFYRILPGSEEPVTDKELKERAGAPGKPPSGARATAPAKERAPASTRTSAPTKDVYFVQAGSFPNPVDADNQKAKLAMLGLESSVEPATLPDKGTWYRVRIGPYTRIEDITQVRQTLAQNGIEASLVKVKSATPPKAR